VSGRTRVEVRPADEADGAAVARLLADSLGWERNDTFTRFFEWKHRENPFGASPAWVAVDGTTVVGFRTFLRWEFEHPDGRTRHAVRAVDTATHPDHQGRGVFRALTLHAVDALRAAGVEFVFNTPNDQSRPGYLSMGWSTVGRLPAVARVAGWRGARRTLAARTPAERWPVATEAGAPAVEVLADPAVGTLLTRLGPARGLRTRRTVPYLRWRYGLPALGYRAVTAPTGAAGGVAVFRSRRRGAAVEATVCELLVPGGDARAARALARAVLRATGADYALRVGWPRRGGIELSLGRRGPVLTWRALATDAPPPRLSDWDFALGDVELL
jgi:GNAT superfamily N-acetyltransferase